MTKLDTYVRNENYKGIDTLCKKGKYEVIDILKSALLQNKINLFKHYYKLYDGLNSDIYSDVFYPNDKNPKRTILYNNMPFTLTKFLVENRKNNKDLNNFVVLATMRYDFFILYNLMKINYNLSMYGSEIYTHCLKFTIPKKDKIALETILNYIEMLPNNFLPYSYGQIIFRIINNTPDLERYYTDFDISVCKKMIKKGIKNYTDLNFVKSEYIDNLFKIAKKEIRKEKINKVLKKLDT
jgi:hypothetical protein